MFVFVYECQRDGGRGERGDMSCRWRRVGRSSCTYGTGG